METGHRRPRRRPDHRVPALAGNQPRLQPGHPQRPAVRDPLAVPLRVAAAPGQRGRHPARPGHPGQPAATRRSSATSPTTEADALLAAPDQATWTGRRDHAPCSLAVRAGLRVSELTSLTRADIRLGTGRTSAAPAKAARSGAPRSTAQAVAASSRLARRAQPGSAGDPLFVTRRGTALSRNARRAPHHQIHRRPPRGPARPWRARTSPPHTLRHSAAMRPCCTPASTSPSSPCGWATFLEWQSCRGLLRGAGLSGVVVTPSGYCAPRE